MIQSLLPHPASPASAEPWHIQCQIELDETHLEFTYHIRGNSTQLEIPRHLAESHRLDNLWQETCFEVFLRRKDQPPGYLEFNFAPSGHWAFYRLGGYRAELERPEVEGPPIIRAQFEAGGTSLKAKIPWSMIENHLPGNSPLEAGLSVILKEKSGVMAYWAVKHPSEKPDFHHPDSFFPL